MSCVALHTASTGLTQRCRPTTTTTVNSLTDTVLENHMAERIQGIFTPNIVPLDDRSRINEEELRRYVDWLFIGACMACTPTDRRANSYVSPLNNGGSSRSWPTKHADACRFGGCCRSEYGRDDSRMRVLRARLGGACRRHRVTVLLPPEHRRRVRVLQRDCRITRRSTSRCTTCPCSHHRLTCRRCNVWRLNVRA